MKNKKNKKKKGLIIAIFIAAILMAVGYAAFQTELTINAIGKIYSDWDVRFTELYPCEYLGANGGHNVVADGTTPDIPLGTNPNYEKPFCSTTIEHLSEYDLGEIDWDGRYDVLGGFVLSGYEISIYTEFFFADDEFVFEVDITNFSETWVAGLVNILSRGTTDTVFANNPLDFIHYEFYNTFDGVDDWDDEITACSSSAICEALDLATGPLEFDGFIIDQYNGTNYASSTEKLYIRVFWNPLLANDLPTGDSTLNNYGPSSNEENPITKTQEKANDPFGTPTGPETYTETQKIVFVFSPVKPA